MAQYWNPDMEKLDRKSIGDLLTFEGAEGP